MKRRVFFLIVLLVLLAPSAFAQTPGVAPIRVGVLTGQIRSVDGTPAAGVRVVAITADSLTQQLISQAETDASGNYRLTGIPSGSYHIAAGRLATLTYFPEGSSPAGARIVTVTDGAVVAEINFKLRRLPVLSGRVVGLPSLLAITELRVRLAPKASPFIETSVTKDGEFAFPDLPNDDYVVSLPSSRLLGVGVLIGVDGADVRGIELQPRALRFGRVVMEDGSPLPAQRVAGSGPSFQVRAGPLNGAPAPLATLNVHADGSFFVGLPDDNSFYDGRLMDYRVIVENLDRDYAVKSIVDGSVDLFAAPLKIGNEITSREIRVTLARSAPGVKVSGTVTGVDNTAVPSRFVRIQTMAQALAAGSVAGWIGEAPIRMDGTFEILNVPPGLTSISTVPPVPGLGISVKVGDSDLTGIKLAPASSQDIDNLPLVGTDPLQLITTLPGYRARPLGHEFSFCCPSSLFVNGRLTGGTPLPESIQLVNTEVPPGIVELSSEPGPGRVLLWAETPVDAEGRFSFWSIPLDTYEVRLLPPGVVPLSLPALNLNQLDLVRNVEIPIPARRILKGRVVLEGGGALPDPVALRVNVTGGTGVPIEADGAFTLLLPLGEYTLTVMNLPDRYFVKTITYGSADLLHGPLHVDGPPSAEVVITLATTER